MLGALQRVLPSDSFSAKEQDTANFCCGFTAFDELDEPRRESLLVDEWELDALVRSKVVFGHFCLPTLLKVSPPRSVATVLREPRARLLSLYTWMRLTRAFDGWQPYRPDVYAMRPLDEFLSEPQIAPIVDSVLCRTLLHGDPRIPVLGFIPPEHVSGVAVDAMAQLDRLGFVGVLERGPVMWQGLADFFGVTLEPVRTNVTESAVLNAEALPIQGAVSERTLQFLEARTAADAIIYRNVLRRDMTQVEMEHLCSATLAAQLVHLGDIGGRAAASAQSLAIQLADAEARFAELKQEFSTQHSAMATLQSELARHRLWLAGVHGSASWRLTSPLRALKRFAVRSACKTR